MQISEINLTCRIVKRNKESTRWNHALKAVSINRYQGDRPRVYVIIINSLFDDPDIGERIKNYVLTINAQESQIEVLEKQISQLKCEY